MAYTIKTFISDNGETGSADKRLTISLKTDGFSFTVFAGDRHLLAYCDVAIDTKGTITSPSVR